MDVIISLLILLSLSAKIANLRHFLVISADILLLIQLLSCFYVKTRLFVVIEDNERTTKNVCYSSNENFQVIPNETSLVVICDIMCYICI